VSIVWRDAELQSAGVAKELSKRKREGRSVTAERATRAACRGVANFDPVNIAVKSHRTERASSPKRSSDPAVRYPLIFAGRIYLEVAPFTERGN
jgi:hypothetical protein